MIKMNRRAMIALAAAMAASPALGQETATTEAPATPPCPRSRISRSAAPTRR
ncbi:MAG: hypothetical protein R3D63_17045 [Paracoccaceae bacterium]